jgi:hypothetical protein
VYALYKDLTKEIHLMWNVKTKVIPVIIGPTGTISKSHIIFSVHYDKKSQD